MNLVSQPDLRVTFAGIQTLLWDFPFSRRVNPSLGKVPSLRHEMFLHARCTKQLVYKFCRARVVLSKQLQQLNRHLRLTFQESLAKRPQIVWLRIPDCAVREKLTDTFERVRDGVSGSQQAIAMKRTKT